MAKDAQMRLRTDINCHIYQSINPHTDKALIIKTF